MEITKEDLAQMSPEQVASLQKQNCIFCHIISGKVSSKKIFEDDICIAILDINPANPGHVLVIPKEHYTILPLLPEDVMQHMMQVTKYISQACLRILKAQGTNIFIANGAIAGQKAPHFMIHVIPRRDSDDVGVFNLPRKSVDDAQLVRLRDKLMPVITQVLKSKPPEQKLPEQEPEQKAPEPKPEPQVFPERKPLPKLDIDQLSNAILSQPNLTAPPQPEATARGEFIASTQSNRVHASNCPLAKKIKDENLVKFTSKKDATDEGYEECDCLR